MLSPDEEKQVEAKVNEYLKKFLAQIRLPEKSRAYALKYAIQVLTDELTPEEKRTMFESSNELPKCSDSQQPQAKGERTLLKDQMKKLHGKD